MDRSQVYNKIAAMLNPTPGNEGSIGKTHVADKTPTGAKATAKRNSNHNVRTTNKQNPNKTYSFDVINKARARMGGR